MVEDGINGGQLFTPKNFLSEIHFVAKNGFVGVKICPEIRNK